MKINNRLFKVQTGILLVGVLYSWTNVYLSFRRFHDFEGTIFKFKDCFIRNPVLTPCFWGASAFLIAFIWSIYVFRLKDEVKRAWHQKRLTYLLTFGTIFAWSVFGYEVLQFIKAESGTIQTCIGEIDTPFKSSCLYGAMIYAVSLFNAISMAKKSPSKN